MSYHLDNEDISIRWNFKVSWYYLSELQQIISNYFVENQYSVNFVTL